MVNRSYGGPEVLRLQQIEQPEPAEEELLVRVAASSVNALDWHFLRGRPLPLRLQYGLLRPRVTVLGYDVAGRVEAVGSRVTRFRPGDEVFAGLGFGLGGFADYACVHQHGFVAHKPANLSFEGAAAVPGAAAAALIGLDERGRLQAGQQVLINGASGGVGTFAVQIARALGAEVTAVCSTPKLEQARALGADRVMDYTREDFAASGQQFELLLDLVGNRSVSDMLRVVRPGGRCVVVGFSSMGRVMQHAMLGPGRARRRGITWNPPEEGEPTGQHLERLKQLLEQEAVVPQIEKTVALEQLPDAIRHVETGHARAKVVVSMA